LDDFYRDAHDPQLPSLASGLTDWDDPRSWHADAAMAALRELVDTGRTLVPTYDIGLSRATGTRGLTCPQRSPILAEGIFADEIVSALRAEGLLLRAYCVAYPRLVTFALRLGRDLREHRKPPAVLLRRGVMLWRREPEVVARAVAAGATRRRPTQVEAELTRDQPGMPSSA
jgi:uridine kinase